MLFNSYKFLFFLAAVFCCYWFVFNKSLRKQNILILATSYFFYGCWSYKFLGLLALSTLLDFAYGFGVASPNRTKAKTFLWLSIINNLGILGVFKYYNFFATQFQLLFESLGIHTNPVLLHVFLPVGISFYTFHGMSYVFDIYRGKQQAVTDFIAYGVFVSFFPLLVAGPIERAGHLLPQVRRKRTFNYTQAVEGCRLMLWGMFKKVVVADNLATIVNTIFVNYRHETGLTLLVGAIAFSFQIYGDFSGYSDIAIGTAKLFGFELLSNFKYPYFSRDIAEFWRRWHISLSSWFRDYLYIPLGGSRQGKAKAVLNTFVIFLVSGFWHGADWKYIAWGGIHACLFLPLLLLNRNRQHASAVVAQDRSLPTLRELLQMVATFGCVTLAWVYFRAPNIRFANDYLRYMGASFVRHPDQLLTVPVGAISIIYILPLVAADWWLRRDERALRKANMAVYILIGFLVYINFGTNNTFIYFQF